MKSDILHYLRIAQNNRCAICGKQFERRGMRRPSLDHVLAQSRGGYSGRGNIVAAHIDCNSTKGSRLPTGCEMIWLQLVCEMYDWPIRLTPDMRWRPPKVKRLWRVPPWMVFKRH